CSVRVVLVCHCLPTVDTPPLNEAHSPTSTAHPFVQQQPFLQSQHLFLDHHPNSAFVQTAHHTRGFGSSLHFHPPHGHEHAAHRAKIKSFPHRGNPPPTPT